MRKAPANWEIVFRLLCGAGVALAMWRQDGQQLHGLNAAGAARRMTRSIDGRGRKKPAVTR